MTTKSELRKQYRNFASNWTNLEFTQREAALNERLSAYLRSQTGVWAAFRQIPVEPDVTHAIDQAQHLRWAYPVVEGAKLHFFMPKSIEHFTQNSWGIWEPHRDHSEEIPLTGLSGILVPALAFDLSGFRLGRGGGYYDRTLAEFTGFKIGLAFSEQIAAAELPHENFDIPMDAIVTEKAVINCLSKLERMKS